MVLAMASPKVKMINVRLKPDTHDDFKIACELRGGSMSSILHQFIVRTIREEKEMSPRSFNRIESQGVPLAPRSKSRGIPLGNTSGVSQIADEKNENRKKKKRTA
jgi:hypothetical protein